ncbi:phosphoribosylglycinamide formyltransferase [Paenibacillus chitinolyticus]|uniref:phosphoribosylglycinamide formyltransferase n=1 Tax=Paenibacillus chitinolyticus TaxID=79263 RepID=UPI001C47DB08|nr:phosphoribosylglycinamide formyltransferase [Paenibacillus chitinolyticus]MBV6717350.1 phosphoribosylglycinamide formyltransferase [Paenibacillus chitinolyticus]
MGKLRIAVFASGSGSNFQAVADAVRSGRLEAELALLVSDRPQSKVVERAKQADVPVFAFSPKAYDSREVYETEILQLLREKEIDLIVLAGYMRILTPVLVEPFYGRMINVHPSLLPAFPGIKGIDQALEYGVKVTGVTVHYVDGGLDSGPIIAQRALEIREDDTVDSLTGRVHAAEHELLPLAIGWIAEGRVTLEGRLVRISEPKTAEAAEQ